MNLKNFQLRAIKNLLEKMEVEKRDIVLKSPTGSGKTIILTNFMSEYMAGNPNVVFVWLTPGKGNLEEQSKRKMDLYVHGAKTKLLSDVMTGGFEEGDACFINWEKLTKKGNNALKDSERTNFLEWINKAFDSGLQFKVIIDESHTNFTEKSDAIIQLFKTDKIIRASATPLSDKNSELIEISEDDVIAEGLIKKQIVINENFPQKIEFSDTVGAETSFLLEKALEKQAELDAAYKAVGSNVNPLIIIQLPSNDESVMEEARTFLEGKNISVENGLLSIWLSSMHENIDGIEENNGVQRCVIMKMAVATGWDCPRAHILVKLRHNMERTFEIQTIGRIRRMAETHHYENEVLDSCYIFTFDDKFITETKSRFGQAVTEAKTLFLKNEYKSFSLTKEQRTEIVSTKDARKARSAIAAYFRKEFSLAEGSSKDAVAQNKRRLETEGFIFSEKIEESAVSGSVKRLINMAEEAANLNQIKFSSKLNTHIHGLEYHNRAGRIGLEIGFDYASSNAILRGLFCTGAPYDNKLLKLEIYEHYAFVINNFDLLRRTFRAAMASDLIQGEIKFQGVSKKEFHIPQSTLFTYNAESKVQVEYSKNVYAGYLSSASTRSEPEKLFEKFLQNCSSVIWFYKNGDKGEEYFSIVYDDNAGSQKLFYPDYIVCVNGETWIIETKGGFSASGESEDIDIYSAKKFEMLKKYVRQNNLHGGFVRQDKESGELFIAQEKYADDIKDEAWELLSEVF